MGRLQEAHAVLTINGRKPIAVTRSFKELVRKHVAEDRAFADALLREGIDLMLAGDVDTGKAILRDYIKATVGFEKLGRATGTQPKSLIRMFGPRGNPQARNLFNVIRYLQKQAGVELHVAPSQPEVGYSTHARDGAAVDAHVTPRNERRLIRYEEYLRRRRDLLVAARTGRAMVRARRPHSPLLRWSYEIE
jgi:hypothetical protein